jgi:hypothetical protein
MSDEEKEVLRELEGTLKAEIGEARAARPSVSAMHFPSQKLALTQLSFPSLFLRQSLAALPGEDMYRLNAEATLLEAQGVPRRRTLPPHIPPPDGWEAMGSSELELGAAEAEARGAGAEEPYFDAPETLPADELITSGAPLPVR